MPPRSIAAASGCARTRSAARALLHCGAAHGAGLIGSKYPRHKIRLCVLHSTERHAGRSRPAASLPTAAVPVADRDSARPDRKRSAQSAIPAETSCEKRLCKKGAATQASVRRLRTTPRTRRVGSRGRDISLSWQRGYSSHEFYCSLPSVTIAPAAGVRTARENQRYTSRSSPSHLPPRRR